MIRNNTPWTRAQIITGHFRQGPGYNAYRENGTEDFVFFYTIGGRGRLGYRTGEFIAKPGDVVLLRPRTFHDYGVEPKLQRWEFIWAHFLPRPHWHDWLNWPEFAPGASHLKIDSLASRRKFITRLKAMDRYAHSTFRAHDDNAMNALEEVLLWCDGFNPLAEQSRIEGRIQQAVDFICRNASQKIDLEAIARASGLSVSRMAHLFRAQVGQTPQRFLEQQRLDRAKQLLAFTPNSIKTIAYELGFENPFYFTLRFKRYTGSSPRQYRKSAQQRQFSG
jgi:AraC family transcriptional regulator of arabinose operon